MIVMVKMMMLVVLLELLDVHPPVVDEVAVLRC